MFRFYVLWSLWKESATTWLDYGWVCSGGRPLRSVRQAWVHLTHAQLLPTSRSRRRYRGALQCRHWSSSFFVVAGTRRRRPGRWAALHSVRIPRTRCAGTSLAVSCPRVSHALVSHCGAQTCVCLRRLNIPCRMLGNAWSARSGQMDAICAHARHEGQRVPAKLARERRGGRAGTW